MSETHPAPLSFHPHTPILPHPHTSFLAGLYVHVPFCTQRCVYCDFYFTTTRHNTGAFASRSLPGFVAALEHEIAWVGATYGKREPLDTLYFGGGTPSVLPLEGVARLLRAVERHFDARALAEVTFEANPENVAGAEGRDYLAGLRALGVTRLSLGVQSFFDADLAFMGRAHDAASAEDAVRNVEKAGFDSWSLDLIFGLPEQPFEYWGANLEKAVRLGAPHLATYGLTVEDGTPLHRQIARGRVSPVADEAMRERYLFTSAYLQERGFEHYEVSAFARTGAGRTHRSRHNEGYWRHLNYVGVGPSAHSFWKATRSRAERWANVRHLGRWQGLLAAHEPPVEAREHVGADALADEFVLLSLRRLTDGLDLGVLARDYGVDLLEEKPRVLAELERAGLVHPVTDRVRLTTEGAAVADAVALKLVG